MRRYVIFLNTLILVMVLPGCVMTNAFMPYSVVSLHYKAAINNSTDGQVLADLNKLRRSADKQLYLVERGRINQIKGDNTSSLNDFAEAIDAVKVADDKAKITLSRTAARTGSLLSNDSVVPYSLDAYEKVMVHHYQALNYIAKGDIGAASVEVRRANFVQQEALERHHKELAKVEEDAKKNDVPMDAMNVDRYTASLSEVLSQVKNSFQNAYSFYLSGLIFEANGEFNDAYIDYKRALEIAPDNTYLQHDVLRLAQSLGMKEDYRHFTSRFKPELTPPNKGDGSVVVFYEHGFIPSKIESRIDVPAFRHGGAHSIAIPFYQQPWRTSEPAVIDVEGKQFNQTQSVVNFYALAAKSLQEEMPMILVRQLIRLRVKYETQKVANDKGGAFAGGAMMLWNMLSERADLRTWSTLPNEVQISRGSLAPGDYALTMTLPGLSHAIDVTVYSGRTTLVYVTNTGVKVFSKVYFL